MNEKKDLFLPWALLTTLTTIAPIY